MSVGCALNLMYIGYIGSALAAGMFPSKTGVSGICVCSFTQVLFSSNLQLQE